MPGGARMAELQRVLRIEEAALWAWPPKETARDEGWLLRARRPYAPRQLGAAAGVRFRRRTWSARSAGSRLVPKRGLPACFQLTDRAAPAGLDAVLEGRGYARLSPVSVLVRDIAGLDPPKGVRIELDRPTPRAMNALCDPHWGPAMRGSGGPVRAHPPAAHVRGAPRRNRPVAGGLCVVDASSRGSSRSARRWRPAAEAMPVPSSPGWRRGAAAWVRASSTCRSRTRTGGPGHARPLDAERAYGYWYRELDPQAA